MGLSVDTTFTSYESVWSSSSVFPEAVETHRINLSAIEEAERNQLLREEIKGIVEAKSVARTLTTSSLNRCVAAVTAYAVSINDPALAASVHFTPSKLEKMNDINFINAAAHIHSVTNTHVAALAPYNITPAFLTELLADINFYSVIAPKPKAMRAQVKSYTSDVKTAVSRMTTFLRKSLDNLVRSIYPATPFMSAYFNSRIIYNYNEHSTGIKGTVTNMETGRGISKVVIEILDYPQQGDVTARISNHAGNYHFKHLTPGMVTLRIRANGYTTTEMPVKVEKNKYKDFDIQLIPEPAPVPVTV